MKKLVLHRIAYRTDGTFGVLLDEGQPFAVTVELPWLNNRVSVSCIPRGTYLVDCIGVANGMVLKVVDVAGRVGIDIHVANTIRDLQGCIGVGENFAEIEGLTAVGASKRGFSELVARVIGESQFQLSVIGVKADEVAVPLATISRRLRRMDAAKLKEMSWDEKLKWQGVKVYDAVKGAKSIIDARESKTKRITKRVLGILEALLKVVAMFSSKGLLQKLL